jgi:hypothetical protein
LAAQNFAAGGDLESFPDRFFGFAARDRFRHKARKIRAAAGITNSFWYWLDGGKSTKPQKPSSKKISIFKFQAQIKRNDA